MGKWERVRLGDIVEKPLSGEWGNEGKFGTGVPVLRTTNFTDDGIINYTNIVFREISPKKFEKKALKYGDIIIEKSGGSDTKPVGRVVYYDGDSGQYIYNNFTAALRVNDDTVDPRYLFLFMFCNYKSGITARYENKTTGIHNLRLNEFLEQVKIPLPPLDEQKRIAKNLDLASKIVKGHKEQLAELDKLVQLVFYEMFGDLVTNEKGWKIKTLKNVTVGKLSYGSGASAVPFDGNIRYLRITDVNENGQLNSDVVSPSEYDRKYVLHDGDILFARSGATVGKTFRYSNKYGKCLYAGYLIRLIPDTTLVLPDYVFSFTKSQYYRRFIQKNMKVVAQPNINAQQYGDLNICVPPLPLQTRFASIVTEIEAQKAQVQRALSEAENLFNSLMQEYFE